MQTVATTKEEIKRAIKDVLVNLAIKDKLPLDMNDLDTSHFNKALKPLDVLLKSSKKNQR